MRIVHPSMSKRDVLRSAVAAGLTDRPLHFLRYETVSLAGPRAVTYRLRGRSSSVVIRHGTLDIDRLVDAFGRRRPALPAAAGAVLASLDRPPRILDLGAGPGLGALALLEIFPDARVTSVEPDPTNVIILRRTMNANPRFTGWTEIVGATGDGGYLPGPGYRRRRRPSTERDGLVQAAAADAFGLLEEADMARLNIQGAEWALLEDARFARIAPPVLVVECHRRGCPDPDPAAHAGRLLSAAGYGIRRLVRARERNPVLTAWRAP